jgi:hypothetical protein
MAVEAKHLRPDKAVCSAHCHGKYISSGGTIAPDEILSVDIAKPHIIFLVIRLTWKNKFQINNALAIKKYHRRALNIQSDSYRFLRM